MKEATKKAMLMTLGIVFACTMMEAGLYIAGYDNQHNYKKDIYELPCSQSQASG